MKTIIKPDEMQILKAQLTELDPNTVLLTTFQYHTEKKEDIGGMKTDRTKSRYRWVARVFSKSDYEAEISRLISDANRLNRFKWWDDPSWDGYVMTHDSDNATISAFMKTKLKKLHSWDLSLKVFDGWTNATKTRAEGYNESSKYETEGYTSTSGETVSLKNREQLLTLVGQTLVKEIFSKTKLKTMQDSKKIKEAEAPDLSLNAALENDVKQTA